MLNNNNKNIIKKLGNKALNGNKMRNIFAVIAIALTTLLITVAITGGTTLYNANELYTAINYYGADCDGYISVNDNNVDKLKDIKEVNKIGISQLASIEGIKSRELLNERVSIEYLVDEDTYEMMGIIPIEGTYPKDNNEILAPTWLLKLINIEAKVGEKLELDVELNGEIKTIEFVLSGYYESIVSRGSGNSKALVSKSFIEKYNKEIINQEGSKTAYIKIDGVSKDSSYNEVEDKIENIANQIKATDYAVNLRYDEKFTSVSNIEQMMAIGIGVVLIIFTGYLIIYNIFYISVTKDIKLYGLLKTVGTTSKQLKKIILRQALALSIIGIPIGLILGSIASKFIIPLALNGTIFENIIEVKLDPYVIIVSILFSLLTVYISCNKPGKIAGKVSPIEAVKFVNTSNTNCKKSIKKGTGGAKSSKMAWSNIVKNKKRVTTSIVSISLSAMVVIFTINASMGMNENIHADRQMTSDITIMNHVSYGEDYNAIDEELLKKLNNIDGIKRVTPYYSALSYNIEGFISGFDIEIIPEGKLKEEFQVTGDMHEMQGGHHRTVSENVINTSVVSLKYNLLEEESERLEIIDGKIDKDRFKKGNSIIYYSSSGKVNNLKAGDDISFTFINRDKTGNVTEVKESFKLMAIVSLPSEGWVNSNFNTLNIEEEKFKSIFPDYKNNIRTIDIELEENADARLVNEEVWDILVKSNNPSLDMSSKYNYTEGIKEMKMTFTILGVILATIFGLIGAINVTNTILTSIYSRKVEFAMLESIGMQKNQLKKMLLYEGIYYIILSSIIIIPMGVIIAYIAPMMLPIYGGFNFTIYLVSTGISILIISALMITIPIIGYNQVSKESIVDRLRINE